MWFNKKKKENFEKEKAYWERMTEEARSMYYNAKLILELVKTSLEETLEDYVKQEASSEEIYEIDKGNSIHSYLIYNEVIFDKIIVKNDSVRFPWRKANNIPQEVFDYFYKRKKCE